MRFYLDNDVDARCRRLLEAAGHECWTAPEAGLAGDADDEQTIYAHNHDAALITHDREFTNRRKRNSIGVHIRLCCEQPDGPELLMKWLDDVLIQCRRPNVVIEVRPNGYAVTVGWR